MHGRLPGIPAFVWVSGTVVVANMVLECRCRLEAWSIGTASLAGRTGWIGNAAPTTSTGRLGTAEGSNVKGRSLMGGIDTPTSLLAQGRALQR